MATFDGLIALAIVVLIVAPASSTWAALQHLPELRVRAVDAAFGLLFLFAWRSCFSILNLYDKFATIPSRMRATLKGVLVMMVPVVAYLAIFHRDLLTIHSVVVTTMFLFGYEINRVAFSGFLLDRLASRDPRRAVIVGSGRRANKAWKEIRTRYHASITMLGFVDDRDPEEMAPDVKTRFLGRLDDLSSVLLNEVVDVILVAMPIQSCYPLMQRAIQIAESVDVDVIYLQDIYATRRLREDMNRSVFRELAPQQDRYLMRLAIKRLVDICGALLGLIVLSPLFLVVAIGIKLSSKGRVFSRQERLGQRRRPFWIVKFRCTVQDADRDADEEQPVDGERRLVYKLRDNRRLTKFGRLISSSSIEKLPQLWNVLMGDMSLVGPSPMTVRDVSLFSKASLMRRFSLKPGITGVWQLNERSEVALDEWINIDSGYIDRWSLLLDFKILARTLGVVVKRSGAI
jgi:lipopolysaccharide/colanic/teichoic acid biosynthesis glycosyltransferase